MKNEEEINKRYEIESTDYEESFPEIRSAVFHNDRMNYSTRKKAHPLSRAMIFFVPFGGHPHSEHSNFACFQKLKR